MIIDDDDEVPSDITLHDLSDLLFWTTRDGTMMPVREMKRTHVQHAMLWCQRRVGQKDWDGDIDRKDGYTYQEWVSIFLVRLFDPTCE